MTAEAKIESEGIDFAIDGHCDILFEMFTSHSDVPFDTLNDLPVTLDKLKKAKVFVTVAALYCPDSHNGAGSADFLSGLVAYAEKFLTGLSRIRSSRELNDCIEQKRPGTIWLLENADALLDFDRTKLAQTGIRVAGLTHMGKNRIGDGNNVPFPEGLTDKGKDLVKELSRDGFAFDTAHLAEPGFRDLSRICEGPIISSHTGVRSLCNTPRNLTREQIAVILDRKGIIGIAADPEMLATSGQASIEDIFHHIDWIAQSFEIDGIGVGTDFCGFHTRNAGFEDITRMTDLARVMLAHGYPVESVQKIMGENWRCFYDSLLRWSP
jgi:membrane dipeptidase